MLDTNVLVSALLFGGRLSVIARHIAEGRLTPCFIDSTFREFQEVLKREKFKLALAREGLSADELVRALADQSLLFEEPQEIPNIFRDIPDNSLLACATVAHASFIVSGDKAVCRLENFRGIPIVTPQQFLLEFWA